MTAEYFKPNFEQTDQALRVLQAIPLPKPQAGTNPYPTHVFPATLQQFIKEYSTKNGAPADYLATAILAAAAGLIGTRISVQNRIGFIDNPIIYAALVGHPGGAKSHSLKAILDPVQRRDGLSFRSYKNQLNDYKEYERLSKQDREGKAEVKEPVFKCHIVGDATIEALVQTLENNPLGVVIYQDELAGLLNNFNRYTGGSDQEFFLQLFNGNQIKVTRKSSGEKLIERPHACIIGTIQYNVLKVFSTQGRGVNGFTDRFLFAIPETDKKMSWLECGEADPAILAHWPNVANRLIDMPTQYDEEGAIINEIWKYEQQAQIKLNHWQHNNTQAQNKTKDQNVKSILAKMDNHVGRLALILQVLYYVCHEGNPGAITCRAIDGAIELSAYYANTAAKVREYIADGGDMISGLADNYRTVHESLPDTFKTAEGVEIAKSIDMSERTFKQFLQNRKLFKKISQGNYEKI